VSSATAPDRPLVKQADLRHYRDGHQTYIDCQLHASDLQALGLDVVYAWFRLISGPENAALSVDVSQIDPDDFPGMDLLPTLRALEEIGAIAVRDGLVTFPNLHAGRPPEDELEASGDAFNEGEN